MKPYLIAALFLVSSGTIASSLYDLQVQAADGRTIPMSTYRGKKIVIEVADPDVLNSAKLHSLDSLQSANPGIAVIVIPAEDFSASPVAGRLSGIEHAISSRLLLTVSAKVKKSRGAEQNDLLKWLTDTVGNGHFNTEVNTVDQLYIISESGVLYAVLEKGVSPEVIDRLLKQRDVLQ